jgi:predicted transposase YbfD/YdcC
VDSGPLPEFIALFADLPDPRIDRTKQHRLLDIVTIALLAVVSGADSWVDIAVYGRSKEGWLRTFLALPNGIPSHDTFGRVFALLDPAAFEQRFLQWVRQVVCPAAEPVIAVDGKTVRRSHDRSRGKGPLHLLNAWATESGVALGQLAVDEHDNEIVALPALLETVALPGAVLTIDAIGCQRQVAETIVAGGADYVLALKGNQPDLQEHVAYFFAHGRREGFAVAGVDQAETLDKGHGRIERRRCWAVDHPQLLAYLDPAGRWPGLRSVVMVTTDRRTAGRRHQETRYYLSSLPADASRLNGIVRTHWRIENQLHWVLDVVFDEDQSRVRRGYADQNLALLRRMALSLLNQDRTTKIGIKGKRLKAGWDDAYLLHILCQ